MPKSNDNSPFSSSIPNIVLDRFRFWDSSHMVVVQVQTRKSSLAIGEAQSRGNASVSGLYKKGESTHGLGSRKEPSAHAEEVWALLKCLPTTHDVLTFWFTPYSWELRSASKSPLSRGWTICLTSCPSSGSLWPKWGERLRSYLETGSGQPCPRLYIVPVPWYPTSWA